LKWLHHKRSNPISYNLNPDPNPTLGCEVLACRGGQKQGVGQLWAGEGAVGAT